MFVSTVDCESKNPSMLVTGGFNRIGEYLFVFPLVKPAAVWICRADFYFFLRFAVRFSGRIVIIVVILLL